MADFFSRIGDALSVLTGTKQAKTPEDVVTGGSTAGPSLGMKKQDLSDSALVQRFMSWVYIASYKNAVSVAEHSPPRLFVTTGANQMKARCKTVPISKSFSNELRSRKHLQQLPHVKSALEIEEVVEHPLLNLFRNPNALPGGSFTLWYLKSIYNDLTGKSYWWLPRSDMGVPSAILNLPPQWTIPIRSRQDASNAGLNPHAIEMDEQVSLKGVAFGANRMKRIFIPAEELAQFVMPDPCNPTKGFGPLRGAMMASLRDDAMDRYEHALNKNMGRPDILLSPADADTHLTDGEVKQLLSQFNTRYRGVDNAGKVHVASGQMKAEKLTMSPREISFIQGRPWTRDQIANAFGVPPSLMKTEGVPRANLEASLWQYMKFTIWPRLIMDAQVINEQVIPMFDQPNAERPVRVSDRLFVSYDNPVPADKEFQLKKQETFLKNSVLTINEVRREEGLDEVPWGDEPMVQGTIYPLGSGDETEPTKHVKQRGATPQLLPRVAMSHASPSPGGDLIQHPTDTSKAHETVTTFMDDEQMLHHVTTHWWIAEDADGYAKVIRCGCCKGDQDAGLGVSGGDELDRTGGPNPAPDAEEKQLERIINDMFAKEKGLAMAQSPLTVDINITELAEQFVDDASKVIASITINAGDNAIKTAGLDLFPWVENAKVMEEVRAGSFKFLEKTASTVQDAFKKSLAEGLELGENIDQLTKRMENVFDGLEQAKRARMIARTESARAQTQGGISAMKEAGFTQKRWVESPDACPFCLDAMKTYNDPVPMDEVYWEEGQEQEVEFGTNEDGSPHMIKLKHNYGDVIGPPLHPQCRGVLIFEE